MATLELSEAVKDADLVILCVSVSTIIRQLPLIKPYLKKNTIVIDTGSSKRKIEEAAHNSLKGCTFVGCHPMAGSANTGFEFADAGLFDGAQCFLTKPHAKVAGFWRALGANPVVLNARLHDAWVARASYLPHLAAFSLFQKNGLGKFSGRLKALNPSAQELARLAASDPMLWSDILLSNKETLAALSDFEKNLAVLKKFLKTKKPNSLRKFIESSNRLSRKLAPVK